MISGYPRLLEERGRSGRLLGRRCSGRPRSAHPSAVTRFTTRVARPWPGGAGFPARSTTPRQLPFSVDNGDVGKPGNGSTPRSWRFHLGLPVFLPHELFMAILLDRLAAMLGGAVRVHDVPSFRPQRGETDRILVDPVDVESISQFPDRALVSGGALLDIRNRRRPRRGPGAGVAGARGGAGAGVGAGSGGVALRNASMSSKTR